MTDVESQSRSPRGDPAPGGRRLREGAGFLFDAVRVRPVARLTLTGLSVLLAVIGVGMLVYPFATNLYQGRLQTQLAIEFERPGLKQAYSEGDLAIGDPMTRLKLPAIGVSTVVVEGTTASALRAGAGHYVNTPLPGEAGNVAIAGHRTTYGKPFANVDRLKPVDEVILETPIGIHTYKVSREPFVVESTDWSVISQTPTPTLTLTACHPKGSAKQRIVVKAEMAAE
ncbi:MAG: class E sortase [Actinomycetota bacterium]|nr:class E sortase [Actinomycetota bacterium]